MIPPIPASMNQDGFPSSQTPVVIALALTVVVALALTYWLQGEHLASELYHQQNNCHVHLVERYDVIDVMRVFKHILRQPNI